MVSSHASSTAQLRGISLGTVAFVAVWSGCRSAETALVASAASSSSALASSGSSAVASSTFATSVGAGGAPATFSCNPVTNDGCLEGETCDTDYEHLAFICYGGSNTLEPCASCGPQKAYCKSGTTCVGAKCLTYCCDDGDCAEGATCDTKMLPKFGTGQVGLCRVFADAGSGGAGGAAPKDPEPDCKAPLTAPSQGSCVPPLGK